MNGFCFTWRINREIPKNIISSLIFLGLKFTNWLTTALVILNNWRKKIGHPLSWLDIEPFREHAKLLSCNWCLRHQIVQLRNTLDFAIKTRRWFGDKTCGNHHIVMKYWRDKDCPFIDTSQKTTKRNKPEKPGEPQHPFQHKKSPSFVACWSDRLLWYQSRVIFGHVVFAI